MLATFQRYLIYQPTRVETLDPEVSGLGRGRAENLTVTTHDGLPLHGWLVRAFSNGRFNGAAPKAAANGTNGKASGAALLSGTAHPAVIYFPGNAGHRGYRIADIDLLSRLGSDVYLFDYRGYGDTPGRPTEENLAADARTIWNYVMRTRGLKPSRVVLLGESLGGGVATRLASEVCRDGEIPAGLILRATFSSLTDVACYHYPWLPVRYLLIDRFPSVQRIPQVTCPILKIHGTEDAVVPFRFGKKLFDAAPEKSRSGVPKAFVELPGAGHNNILNVAGVEYREAIAGFLARVGGRP
jgi:hypothetical protein